MPPKTTFSWDRFKQTPVVGIIRGMSHETANGIAMAYQKAGFYALEVTMNTKGAAEIISFLHREFPDLSIGAGTVCNMNDLEEAIDAGSNFIVTPILDQQVVLQCQDKGIPIFPGAFTPTEIYKAWSWGASAVKVFPATQLGVQYIKEVLAPLNEVKLLPTGGVSMHNIRSFFEAGAAGVGMGSSLFPKKVIQEQDFNALSEHLQKLKSEIADL